MSVVDLLICPICNKRLRMVSNSLKCDNNHSYDISSSGYVNLLKPGKASNKNSGDDKDMITSRTDFLESGLYDGLSDAVIRTLEKLKLDNITLLDCGCGEGYHTNRIVAKSKCNINSVGIDASKNGVSHASKKSNRLFLNPIGKNHVGPSESAFIVSNIFELPLKNRSIDVVLSAFAPISNDEVKRVIKNGGYLFVISSGEKHLWELREMLYDLPRESKCNILVDNSFIKISSEQIKYLMHIESNSLLINLFKMTPFYYRTSQKDKEKLNNINSSDITVEFDINVYRYTEN